MAFSDMNSPVLLGVVASEFSIGLRMIYPYRDCRPLCKVSLDCIRILGFL